MLSPLSSPKDRLTLALRTLRDLPARVPVLFAVAAFLTGYGGSAYAVWVSGLFANRGEGIYCVQNCSGAYEAWYSQNLEATKYASITPRIAILSFPVAMTLATIFAMSLGWLPNIRIRRLLPGLGLLYCGGVATAALAMLSFALSMSISFPLGLACGLLAAAAYFYSPVLARAVMTGRDLRIGGESGRVFFVLLLSFPLGVIVGAVLHGLFPTFILTYGIPVALGAFFGASLALPRVSPQLLPIPAAVLPTERRTIEHLVLALGAQIAVSTITLFQLASRPLLGDSRPALVAPFILTQLPFILLICVLLKHPGRRAFTFLIAMLAFGIFETFFNPAVEISYRQIYLDHPIGLLWLAFSGLIYIITGVLAYMVIQKTGLRPKLWSVILGTVGMFCYVIFVQQVTPNLNGLWK